MNGLASAKFWFPDLSFVPLQSLLKFEYAYDIFIEGLTEVFDNEVSNPSEE